MNCLAAETSPYRLQHVDNPVDWYPWGDEACARARAQDKPILLSVGYAACHWCHVGRFTPERLECRNISCNILHSMAQSPVGSLGIKKSGPAVAPPPVLPSEAIASLCSRSAG